MNKISEIKVSYSNKALKQEKITCSFDSHQLFEASWNKDIIEFQEEFKVLLLNKANNVLGVYNASKGGVSGTVADAKIIFSVALKCHASALVLAHNHPSGSLKPSEADKKLTRTFIEAGKLLDILVLDHIIITSSNYFSFADEGLI